MKFAQAKRTTALTPWIAKEKDLIQLVKELLPDPVHVSVPFERIRSDWEVSSRHRIVEYLHKEDILRERSCKPEVSDMRNCQIGLPQILHEVASTFISTLRLKTRENEFSGLAVEEYSGAIATANSRSNDVRWGAEY